MRQTCPLLSRTSAVKVPALTWTIPPKPNTRPGTARSEVLRCSAA